MKAKGGTITWRETLAYKHLCQHVSNADEGLSCLKISVIKKFGLRNGDKVEVETFVLVEMKNRRNYVVGKVIEALQIYGSDTELQREPDMILLSLYNDAILYAGHFREW